MEYEKYDHSVGKMMTHLEWCTKYRYKMFKKQEYLKLVEAYIRRAASLHQICIIEINVQPEHVHCVVSFSFTLSTSKVLQILKGLSAKLFFEYHEKAREKYPEKNLYLVKTDIEKLPFEDNFFDAVYCGFVLEKSTP